MAHVGLSDIENALKNSGLPFDTGENMRGSVPVAGQALEASVPRQEVGDFGYKAKLAQVAAMDQKLAKLYGDPTSNLYIENPMSRAALQGGAEDTGYSELADIQSKRVKAENAAEQERQTLISQSEEYYKQLVAIQEKEEKELKKAAKGKGGTGKRKTVTAVEELAGFADPEAAAVWSSQLNADQKRKWLQAMTENTILDQNLRIGDGLPPEGGYTTQDVMDYYANEKARAAEEKRKKDEEKKKKKAGTSDVLTTMLEKVPD